MLSREQESEKDGWKECAGRRHRGGCIVLGLQFYKPADQMGNIPNPLTLDTRPKGFVGLGMQELWESRAQMWEGMG